MDLKKPLTLMCFFSTDEEHAIAEMGIQMSEPGMVTERVFFTVESIVGISFTEGGPEYGCIYSGGEDFVTNIPYEMLKEALLESLYEY